MANMNSVKHEASNLKGEVQIYSEDPNRPVTVEELNRVTTKILELLERIIAAS